MTSEPQDQHQPDDTHATGEPVTGPAADPTGEPTAETASEAQSVSVRPTAGLPHKTSKPATGVSPRSNTADAWDQIRQTAESTTQKLNDFRHRNQNMSELEKTARHVAERGREETGRGLRALAEAAGKLADLVDGKAGSRGEHVEEPREGDQP
jgi:hypothetical protein